MNHAKLVNAVVISPIKLYDRTYYLRTAIQKNQC